MRSLRLVTFLLLAACASTRNVTPLRVMVYNIHAGKDAAGVDNLERVAGLIRSSDADLVLLQEVDRNTERSGRVDQLAELERLTGLHGVLGKSLDYQGGDYGIATLSRWPIEKSRTVHLPVNPPQERAGGSHEPRVALVVETNGMTVVNTHLDASGTDLYRLQEAGELTGTLKPLVRSRVLAAGDFNSNPDSAVHERMIASGMRDAWLECGKGDELTYPASKPVKRIDYLYLGKPFHCSSAKVLETEASDHRPVLIVVE